LRRIVTIAALLFLAGAAAAQQTAPQTAPPANQASAQRIISMMQAQRNAALDAHAFAEARAAEMAEEIQRLTEEVQKLRAQLAVKKD
jgi:uncharacterized protein YicC (UPF0701 family)